MAPRHRDCMQKAMTVEPWLRVCESLQQAKLKVEGIVYDYLIFRGAGINARLSYHTQRLCRLHGPYSICWARDLGRSRKRVCVPGASNTMEIKDGGTHPGRALYGNFLLKKMIQHSLRER